MLAEDGVHFNEEDKVCIRKNLIDVIDNFLYDRDAKDKSDFEPRSSSD